MAGFPYPPVALGYRLPALGVNRNLPEKHNAVHGSDAGEPADIFALFLRWFPFVRAS